MDISKLEEEANKVIEGMKCRPRDEVAYIIGKIIMTCLNEFDDAIKYQQEALINIINAIYDNELTSNEKELSAEPYRLALEKLEQLKLDSRKASK
jgi:hypothetical protein